MWLLRPEPFGCIQDLLLVFPEVSSQVCKDATSEKLAMAGVGMGKGIVGGCWEGKAGKL